MSKPLEWMYAGKDSNLQQEDYLTGKKIDRNFELNAEAAQKQKTNLEILQDKPTTSGSLTNNLLDLDTIRKEDPLVAMKVREEKIKQEVMANPVKRKKLRKIILKEMQKKLMKTLQEQSKNGHKNHASGSENSSADGNSSDSDDDRSYPRSHPKRAGGRDGRDSDRSRRDDRPDQRNRRKIPGYGLVYASEETKERATRRREEERKYQEESSRKREEEKPKPYNPKDRVKPKKLSQDELKAKLEEMQGSNVAWREDQRERRRRKHEHETQKEREEVESEKNTSADFLKPMWKQAVSEGTVEDRIKSKRFKIQRHERHMDANFARK